MSGQLVHHYIQQRLKNVFLNGIAITVLFFFFLYLLALTTTADTFFAQMILLGMAFILTIGYLSLIPDTEKEHHFPLLLFFLLNLLTTALVWATGILQSPFIILYVVLIIITSQLYSYGYGLAQTCLALVGFVGIYTAAIQHLIPYITLLPKSTIAILYQPTIVIFVYGSLYGLLFFFTVFSSSSARTVLFRPKRHGDLDTTYQEKIIQDMPVGVLIVDHDLTIIGNNPAASFNFPFRGTPAMLTDYLSLSKINPAQELKHLAKNTKEKNLTWKVDTGEVLAVTVSVRRIPGAKKDDDTFILFIQ
ncbi:MAG TPA: hypothetical protein DCY48_03685 [Candidatus Magasanikbacteria bacterium]|nr:MAG: hypothetical protein A3I74_04590 [Candidatus Magasanikbacteria bacterium RIFCSPLOWO2_02_FULL_47_16]OGH79483.1 MAG: hypothetical protein A3C10_01560 [Candidatus Magasanikbacteria bacterium RIFCSPHIGHO2_02_FULL_48_18]OGH82516.1 MAG: hypothetical protein A3G08_04050 [Candidatus Magasanikbacteria bacterium RIFCSPLOWO2_12_FULL_47_9b]HAZ28846.1 hypothetical protein [Candidatus Magasanikbacteria bacterium]